MSRKNWDKDTKAKLERFCLEDKHASRDRSFCMPSHPLKDSEEACQLVEAGFNYVCTTPDELMLFRKRK